MTDPSNVNIPNRKLIRKTLIDNKEEVFYKQELTNLIEQKFSKRLDCKTVRYHADQLADKDSKIDRIVLSQNDGVIWGFKDAIQKVREKLE